MQRQMLDVQGINTYCLEQGAGPPVVLLHGAAIAVDAYITWFRTIPALATSYRVIAFDQLGFGRTDLPRDGCYKNRLERVDHVVATLEALGVEDACLVGHSEGGFIAARIAITHPRLVSRLVIVTSGGTAPYLGGDADTGWMSASNAAYNNPTRLESENAFINGNSHLSKQPDPDYEAILRENYRRAIEVGQPELFASMPESETDYRAYGNLQLEYVLPHAQSIRIPTLLVWADADATVPVARGLKLMECLPNSELHVLRDSAHNVMHDQYEKFNLLLRGFCAPMKSNG